jgi:hypothetical protein
MGRYTDIPQQNIIDITIALENGILVERITTHVSKPITPHINKNKASKWLGTKRPDAKNKRMSPSPMTGFHQRFAMHAATMHTQIGPKAIGMHACLMHHARPTAIIVNGRISENSRCLKSK